MPTLSPSHRWKAVVLSGAAVFGLSASGCASMLTQAAVTQFQEQLEAGNLAGMQGTTTERFDSVALPNDSALATFDLLGMPIGEVTVEEVIETSPTTRDVLVTVEGSARKLTYHFIKEGDSLGRSKWLIDEITIRQGSKSSAIEKTVTEQMTLLLGVRDVVRTWQRAEPGELMQYASSQLAPRLEQLSPEWRSQLANRFFGGVLKSKPKAKLVDGQAEITLSHKEGQLRLILEESETGDANWVVKTAVLIGRGKQVTRELRREADLLGCVGSFAKAYEQGDKSALKTFSHDSFYKHVLSVADVSQRPLDVDSLLAAKFDVRHNETTQDLTVTLGDEVLQFTTSANRDVLNGSLRVNDMTTYRDGQAIRLSAELLVLPTVAMFADALEHLDVEQLRRMTATNWAEPVWAEFGPERYDVLEQIALPPFESRPSDPASIPVVRYNGATIEVRQMTGDALVSYQLTSSSQRLVVNDVELIDRHGVMRLRSRLAAARTLDQIADGLLMGDVDTLQAASTTSLNRLVWALTAPEELPASLDLLPLLRSRVRSIDVDEHRMLVTVGDGLPQARMVLNATGTRLEDVAFLDRSGIETSRFAGRVRQHRIDSSR